MTASRLGKKVGVSESTVVRFAAELGYDGYPDMQKSLQKMIRNRLRRFRQSHQESVFAKILRSRSGLTTRESLTCITPSAYLSQKRRSSPTHEKRRLRPG